MKKKNGFTLIELLVAIALMLTILGIAIVSFINVSDRKKEEAWENVKGQIETAAEQYFKSNEYLFEGLATGSSGTISVGKLVSEDYLNSVTNPVTGKKVSYCMLVTVTNNNGVFTTKIDEGTQENEGANDKDCPSGNSIMISEAGGPKLSPEAQCGSYGDNDWCKYSDKGVTIKANADENGNGPIVLTKHVHSSSVISKWPGDESSSEGAEYNTTSSTSGSTVCFKATNSKGKTAEGCVTYKLDMDLPKGSIEIQSTTDNGLKAKEVNITGTATDITSGVATVTSTPKVSFDKSTGTISSLKDYPNGYPLFTSYDGSEKQIIAKVKDVAGNVSSIESNKYRVYKECEDTKFLETTKEVTSACSGSCGGKKTITEYDKYVDTITNKLCDKEIVQKYEEDCEACKSCPTVVPTTNESTKGWYNTNVKFKVTNNDGANWHWLTDNNCKVGSKGCVTIDGKTYMDWNINKDKGNYITSREEEISGEGNRQVRVRIYNGDGTYKDCPPTSVNIDKTAPKVTLNSVFNHTRYDDGTTKDLTINNKSIQWLSNKGGEVDLCLNKGEVSPSGYVCTKGSNYTVEDINDTEKSFFGSYVLTDDKSYCTHKSVTNDRCPKKSTPYPFPTIYKLCFKDVAGNEGCAELKYVYKMSGYTSYWGWKNGWSNSDSNWSSTGWETKQYSDFNK